jgi:hypothetical protein
MTASVPPDAAWTLDDLVDLPEDGSRHEIIEESLLVSPAPALPHFYALSFLQRLLSDQAPHDYVIGGNVGVLVLSKPGQPWHTDDPFGIDLDPADFC